MRAVASIMNIPLKYKGLSRLMNGRSRGIWAATDGVGPEWFWWQR
jgi:hypothetical protein